MNFDQLCPRAALRTLPLAFRLEAVLLTLEAVELAALGALLGLVHDVGADGATEVVDQLFHDLRGGVVLSREVRCHFFN